MVETLLLLALGLLPFVAEASRALSAGAVIVWLASKAYGNRPFFSVRPIVWASYLALLVVIGLSIFAVPSDGPRSEALVWLLRWCHYIGIFFATSDIFRDAAVRRRFILMFLGTMVIVCLNGVYQMITGADFIHGYPAEVPGRITRMRSCFLWPNSFGMFLIMACPLAFAEWTAEKKWSWRALLKAVVFVLFSACLLLSFSRSALLALGAGILVMIVVAKAWRALMALGLFTVLLYLSSAVMRFNFFQSLSWQDITVNQRLAFWKGAWGMFVARPLQGWGIGMSPGIQRHFADVPRDDLTHNAYLQLAAEAGLPGLILFLVPSAALIVSGLRKGPRSITEMALWTGCLAYFFQAFVESSFYYLQPALLFWIFWAMTTAKDAHDA